MLYTEQDYSNAKSSRAKKLIIALGILLVTLALFVTGLIIRNVYLAVGSTCVGFCALYTWFYLQCLPWMRYCKYLSNMTGGRKRETECYFMDIADSVRIVDGVQIHDFNASLDEKGVDSRLFYWDDDKPIPDFKKGDKLTVTSYGNFIIAWKKG